jgi:CubicO group peptidase (beta-lactamase class C family)
MRAGHEMKQGLLDEFVDKVIKEKGIPGVAVGVLHKGEAVTASFGVTNVNHPLPVTDDTLFQIGSATKTFTVTAIMRLVEMGKLDLNTTVQTYAPDFKVSDEMVASQATIRHLLTHTGGWEGDFFDDTGAGEDALAKYMANMAKLEQLAPLGTVFSYCNSGFSLAGYLVEVVTGMSYQAAVKELVLDPIGLKNSYFEPSDVMTHRFAVGHNVTEKGPQVARPWRVPRWLYPGGGITCHVQDLLSYARFHLGDGRKEGETELLSAESMAQMHSPQVTIWGDDGMGLSWFISEIEAKRILSHSGDTNGHHSSLVLIPEDNFAIAILTNGGGGQSAVSEISRWALKQYLGLETIELMPIESSEQELAPYVGRYSRPFADIELGMLGGELVGQVRYKKAGFSAKDSLPPPAPPSMSLALCEKDRLLVLDGPSKGARSEFVRKSDGSIGWLRFGGRIHVREA